MQKRLNRILSGELAPNVLPFLWLHGEDEATLRKMMAAIDGASCRAVCLESRPHPDYCGPQWWHDLDVLLDEARKRHMEVWILDDSHFPTGYANGALKNADPALCRRFCTRTLIRTGAPVPTAAPAWQPGEYEQGLIPQRVFDDDAVLGTFDFGNGTTAVMHLTRNRGPHRTYINMADAASVKVLLDAVYEPHYRRYAADFGKTIAGFFSDEPELGNDHLYEYGKRLWENDDLVWSDAIESALRMRWHGAFVKNLALLWEPEGTDAAKARFDYMDVLTQCVQTCFSEQIGTWCRAHGVSYIGHMIEDNDQHTRTGSSLGHYFRDLFGQDMAGIDIIGGQVLPQGETVPFDPRIGKRDGTFYHYTLAKLGASLAALDPKKHGRTMCELFGNYGWGEGVRLMRYLADFALVRGVNRFVPHAFTAKAFPDPDCPPHFYAHGHNPQYRHFGALVRYMTRLSMLFDGGVRHTEVAILYNAVGDWTGETLPLGALAKPLYDARIDYTFVPEDAFTKGSRYILPDAKLWLVPGMQYLTQEIAEGLLRLRQGGKAVWFVGIKPDGLCSGAVTVDWEAFPCIPTGELAARACTVVTDRVRLDPESDRIRVLHYDDAYFLVNESNKPYCGKITFPESGTPLLYNAWENRLEAVPEAVTIYPDKALCFVFGIDADAAPVWTGEGEECIDLSTGWRRSVCEAIDYPCFTDEKPISLPDRLAFEQPCFSGLIRYERKITVPHDISALHLVLTDAAEGVELFVNGKSFGLQIAPPFVYDLSACRTETELTLCIEVATTLERKMSKNPAVVTAKSGITGSVALYAKRPCTYKENNV